MTRREQSIAVDVFPSRILCAVEGNDSITRFESGLFRSAALFHEVNHRLRRRRDAVHQSAGKRNRERGNNVHHRPGERDHNALPTRPEVVHLSGWNIWCTRALEWSIGLVAAELYIAAERDRRDAVISVAPLLAEQARPEADREGLHSNTKELG